MADDAPGSWTNVEDQTILPSVATFDTVGRGIVGMMQHGYELTTNEAAGNTVQAIGHSHGDAKGGEDGVAVPRTLWSKDFRGSSGLYAEGTLSTAGGWLEMLSWRCWVPAFRNVAFEIDWYVTTGNGIKLRLRHAPAVNDGNVAWATPPAGETTHYLERQAEQAPVAMAWMWLTGQVDGAGGSSEKLLPIWTAGDGVITSTDFKTMLTRREFLLEGIAPTNDTTFRISHAALHALPATYDLS